MSVIKKEFIANEQQSACILFVEQNPTKSLIIRARAGCGKTALLCFGICKTLYFNTTSEVAIMAFNKNAADEIKTRIASIGLTDFKKLMAGTVHSFGFGIWRKVAPAVKVDENKVYGIIRKKALPPSPDTECVYRDCEGVLKQVVSLAKQAGFGFKKEISDVASWYQMIEHFGIDDDLEEQYTVEMVIEACQKILRESLSMDREVIDFDDMILAPLAHKAKVRYPKDVVIIDEAQDTNEVRRALARIMLKPGGRLIACGDDRQAIYGFTGANSDSLEIIEREFDAEVLPLNVTFRCPKVVVAMAQKLVPDFTAHPDAPEGIYREIAYSTKPKDGGNQDIPWFANENLAFGDAIICRNTKPLIDQAYALLRAGIGCVVEGRDIGKGLIKLATKWRGNRLAALVDKLEDYKERERTKWIAKGKEEKAAAVEDKVDTLICLIGKCCEDNQNATIVDLTNFVERLFGDATDKYPPKVVRLLSIHRAKGLEYRRVFMLGRLKYLPSKYARKEWQKLQEQNLEYVKMTRTMEEAVDVHMEAA